MPVVVGRGRTHEEARMPAACLPVARCCANRLPFLAMCRVSSRIQASKGGRCCAGWAGCAPSPGLSRPSSASFFRALPALPASDLSTGVLHAGTPAGGGGTARGRGAREGRTTQPAPSMRWPTSPAPAGHQTACSPPESIRHWHSACLQGGLALPVRPPPPSAPHPLHTRIPHTTTTPGHAHPPGGPLPHLPRCTPRASGARARRGPTRRAA